MIGRSSTSSTSLARRSKRCVNAVSRKGWKRRWGRRQRSRDRAPVLDGEGETQLVAIACSEPPGGRARWTLHLLADELKRRKIVHTISHETVRKMLKKTRSSRGANRCGTFRPSRDAAFVCAMEQVLGVYTRPYDAAHPVICMDETTKQCAREVRTPLPTVPGHPARYDAEYERNGVGHLLICRVGGGAPWGWPPSAAQTARTVFP